MRAKVFMAVFGILLFTTCKKQDEVAPTETVENAQLLCNADLAWLKDIIKKADEDKATKQYKGNYMGTIHVVIFNNEPLFLVRMMMGSGGLAGYVFTCAGTRAYPDPPDFESNVQNKGKLIYNNIP